MARRVRRRTLTIAALRPARLPAVRHSRIQRNPCVCKLNLRRFNFDPGNALVRMIICKMSQTA